MKNGDKQSYTHTDCAPAPTLFDGYCTAQDNKIQTQVPLIFLFINAFGVLKTKWLN